MNKQQLVDLIAVTNGISKAQASLAIDQVTNGISKALASGESVVINGFGAFKYKHKEAGVGRNPRTGETIAVKAKNLVSFSAGDSLIKKVNQ